MLYTMVKGGDKMAVLLVKRNPEKITETIFCNKNCCLEIAGNRIPYAISNIQNYIVSLYFCDEHLTEYLSLFKGEKTTIKITS